MRGHQLDFEVSGELVADGSGVGILLVVEEVEFLLADHRVVGDGLTSLRKTLGTDQLGGGILSLPLRQEYVVLNITSNKIADVAAELGDLGLHLVGQSDRGEDGKSAGS
ncbi:hypothetical protein RRF57_008010 [Xylaria bambusicola]|uniref:Uncharacterized protein n=1 Tax=Xylaria bambusicola TaxID=326684 RepID=A0AAN7UT04_9PEZI